MSWSTNIHTNTHTQLHLPHFAYSTNYHARTWQIYVSRSRHIKHTPTIPTNKTKTINWPSKLTDQIWYPYSVPRRTARCYKSVCTKYWNMLGTIRMPGRSSIRWTKILRHATTQSFAGMYYRQHMFNTYTWLGANGVRRNIWWFARKDCDNSLFFFIFVRREYFLFFCALSCRTKPFYYLAISMLWLNNMQGKKHTHTMPKLCMCKL